MIPARADLDNLASRLHSSDSARMAARRVAWGNMSARQRRRVARAAAREYCTWLRERETDGRRQPA